MGGISKTVGWVILALGIVFGIHSAMGVSQFKHFIAIHESPEGGALSAKEKDLPMDIRIECLGALLAVLIAITFLNGEFKEIINPPGARVKCFDSLFYTEDFISFNHRKNPVSVFGGKDLNIDE